MISFMTLKDIKNNPNKENKKKLKELEHKLIHMLSITNDEFTSSRVRLHLENVRFVSKSVSA